MGSIDERLLAVAVLALLLLAAEAGYRIGRRPAAAAGGTEHLGALQNAALGLLALLLAFTFSMAVSRYEARKHLVLEEANAIGTTALRAQMLPQPQRAAALVALRDYVATRLAFHEARRGDPAYQQALAGAAHDQQALWELATSASAADPHSLPVSLFVQSLNDTIDVGEKRLVARESHVPDTVLVLLLVVAVLALGFVGCGAGLAGHRRWPSTSLFALMLALVVTLVVDIDRPRQGLIRVQQESMLRLQASLGAAPP